MKQSRHDIDSLVDNVTEKIRDERLPDAVVSLASKRVWARLTNEEGTAELPVVDHIRSCDDFRLLIPAYQRGVLPPARTLLLEDHMRECIPCRKAMKDARNKGKFTQQPNTGKPSTTRYGVQPRYIRWAIAAVIVLALGSLSYPYLQKLLNNLSTLQAIVEAAEGDVYKVTSDKTEPVKPGDKLLAGERLRTAKSSTAYLKMLDGTKIEMRERAEIRMTDTSSGAKIHLDRGNIIVEAAKQKDRHLFVASDDTLVSVTGTIFSVNSGTKGSRVSVIEGSVEINSNGKNNVLKSGNQITTHPSIEKVAIKDEVSWSRNYEHYQTLLASIHQDIDSTVSLPGNRFSTKLLDIMPENTVLYIAVPNLSNMLDQADSILRENIAKNAELQSWYDNEQSHKRGNPGVAKILHLARQFGPFIGDEIVLTSQLNNKGGEPDEPVIVAELKSSTGIREMIETKVRDIGVDPSKLSFIDDPLQDNSDHSDKDAKLFVWMNDSIIAVASKPESLRNLAGNVKSNSSKFTESPFHSQIAAIYAEGAGFVIAADLEKLVVEGLRNKKSGDKEKVVEELGLTNLRYFIIEIKEKNGSPFNRAIVSFKESDHGITSWLAAPGPMGALDFISPDASVVGAFVMKEPTSFIDDIFNSLKAADNDGWESLQKFQAEKGLDLRNDFAQPMGGEYAFAIDGPLLPTPSWKVIVEIDEPVRMQSTLERTVANLNAEMHKRGKKGLEWSNSESSGTKFYRLHSLDAPVEVNYAYVYGYLVAAPSRVLVENAIKYRESGYSLANSVKFKSTLPEDKQANFSAMVYQNLAATLPDFVKGAAKEATKNAPNDVRKTIDKVLLNKASLAYVYALNDRMILSINSEDGPIGLSPSMFLRLPGAKL